MWLHQGDALLLPLLFDVVKRRPRLTLSVFLFQAWDDESDGDVVVLYRGESSFSPKRDVTLIEMRNIFDLEMKCFLALMHSSLIIKRNWYYHIAFKAYWRTRQHIVRRILESLVEGCSLCMIFPDEISTSVFEIEQTEMTNACKCTVKIYI